MSKYREDDIKLLLPSMQAKVGKLIARMVELKYQPILFDGYRTATESARNAAKGTGIKQSMHEYGCAADVICDEHGWNCRQKKCKFYTVLGREANALGLYWGGDFSSVDQPHVQGIPAIPRIQNVMRALGTAPESLAARDAMVVKYLKKVSPAATRTAAKPTR
jgi:hypothetical protein